MSGYRVRLSSQTRNGLVVAAWTAVVILMCLAWLFEVTPPAASL